MWALFKRELNGFFNSLIAYVVVAVFLLITALFLWVFPAGFNIIESGFANLDGLFVLGPFVFMFLVPAITMRFFAEEKRSGTLEILMTKPVTDVQVVLAKYLAGAGLVLVSLLPTLLYLLTVYLFADAAGVDMGGVWGSYLGLFLLGMVFVAIGLFASSLTENQIIAFIIALFLCGFLFFGFEMLHSLHFFGQMDFFVRELGLYSHYSSMGRGVVDSRDVLYFLGLIILFLALARLRIGQRYTWRAAGVRILVVLIFILAINALGIKHFIRLDLTSDQRYTLTRATRNMLGETDDIIYFRVYLEGNLPAEFRRLRNDVREMLDEFSAWSDHIQFDFVSPSQEAGDRPEDLERLYRMLAGKGLQATQIQMRDGDGTSQRVIFPGALVSYKDREVPVHFLDDHLGLSILEVLHNSSVALEYKLASAIRRLTVEEKQRIAFLEGHGELPPPYVASIKETLKDYYEVERVKIGNSYENIGRFRTLISAKPQKAFSEGEKFLLDQFLMRGGSVLWLVDPVYAEMDSLARAPQTIGLARDINMDDFFFNYGVRLNPVLLKDLNAAPHPFTTGFVAGRPQINLLPWVFFPVITPLSDHEIVKNLNLIRTEFVSSIDTVDVPDIRKHILLETSRYTRVMPVPVHISLDILQHPPDESMYAGPPQAVAVLLEGPFGSLFKNRMMPEVNLPENFERKDKGSTAAMIVMADGDVIKNQFDGDGRPLPLGYDRYTGHTFGNADFIINAVNYLSDDSGIIQARARDMRMRLLDKQRVDAHQIKIQVFNTIFPVLLIIAFGALRLAWRRRHYSN